MSKMENKILKKFEVTDVTIEVVNGVPMFELYSVGMALGYINKRTSKGKEYISPYKSRIDKTAQKAEIKGLCQGGTTLISESQLYDFMLEARTDKCKPFRKWVVEEVLPLINKTGGYVEKSQEELFVDNYLHGLSEETKIQAIKELHDSNEELQEENRRLNEWHKTFIETEGLIPMNIVSKELKIGLKRLYLFLRNNDVMFYKGNLNIPYQRFMEQKLFEVKETPCKDGKYRPQTYATRKGLEYIRKMLVKKNKLFTN